MTPSSSSSNTPIGLQTPTLYAWPKGESIEEVLKEGITDKKIAQTAHDFFCKMGLYPRTPTIEAFENEILPLKPCETGRQVKVLQSDVFYLLRRLEDRDQEIEHLTREKEELQDENFCLSKKLEFLQRFINIYGIARDYSAANK